MSELVVASFNVHAGVDGWGRPFDVVAACGELDADVLFLQENWIPENSEGLASMVASSLGYQVREAPLSGAILFEPPPPAGGRWGPSARHRRSASSLWVTDAQTLSHVRRQRPQARGRLGSWGIAVLSRFAMEQVRTVELGRLAKDHGRLRAALFAEINVAGSPVTVVGTHLAHFMHGSPLLLERLRSSLPAPSQPAVLAGDMNFWGPPVSLALPGWRRAVRARTYPTWHVHSQIDHILVTRGVKVVSGESVPVGRSDHWPIRARLLVA